MFIIRPCLRLRINKGLCSTLVVAKFGHPFPISYFLLLVVVAPVIVMDGDGSSNAVAGPSTLPDVIISYLPPAGKSFHFA